ncbi:hypothetical protein G5V59_00125 [Nocardioides sp. W3-2-3]|uniref:hypothetical protein n=1 Tax=Nocardioides convexus TaxID=2712224 RepID=UPI0024182C9E|nr:hypothetical protein [Nocardioides convexus]NGZ99380.1 hypothetical protein [Nocardioides convexus]
MTSAEAARAERAAASALLDLARNAERVLHISPTLVKARYTLEDVAAIADVTLEGRVIRANGHYRFDHANGGRIRFVSGLGSLHPFTGRYDYHLVVLAAGVDLTREPARSGSR